MAMGQIAPAVSWALPYSPLNQPLLQVPYPRPRAIRTQSFITDNLPPQLENRFTPEQLQSLMQHFPGSFASLTNTKPKPRRKPTTSTSTTTTSTTTTTTTTTMAPPLVLPRRARPERKGVPKFYYGGIEGREDYAVGPAEDDAIVLLVGLFNLLAIVVYAASKFVMGERGGLPDRVIQWQVQKVLDELVIKVHSSQYVANLLSRAMPPEGAMFEEGRRVDGHSTPSWVDVLHQKIQLASQRNSSRETTEWLSKVKDRLMTEIGSSPAAISTVRLHPQIYKPLKMMYLTVTSEEGFVKFIENTMGGSETGRSLAAMTDDIPGLLNTLSRLSLHQIQSILATLTALGRAQQRVNIIPLLMTVMGAGGGQERGQSYQQAETARVISEGDSFAETLAKYVSQSYSQPQSIHGHHNQQYKTRFSRLIDTDSSNYNDRTSQTTKETASRRVPMRRRPSQLVKRQGLVENESSVASNGHWTDRWFSLVTQVSPVGLDIITLYARARARPSCLRALLCRANNAWRQVGPVQAALTPFTSVLVSWLLEDTTPHSLGDSLIAIRAGWMGKDCSILYSECPLHPDPHPAAKEAITFFSRLQFAATAPPETNVGASGPQSAVSETIPFSSGTRPANKQKMTNTFTDRIDYQSSIDEQQPQTTGSRPPYPSYPLAQNNPYVTSTPKPQYHYSQDHPMATNSPRPANNYRLPESEQSHFPNRRPMKEEDLNENTATMEAYYNRYKGQGPMAVPGSQYSSKYGHLDNQREEPENINNNNNKQLYDKYDSSSSNTAQGEISGSNSVAGMALQDRPTGNNAKVWQEFFNAGLYGGTVPQSSQNKKEESNPATEKSVQLRKPMKRPVSSLNKMGALLPDQPGFYSNPGYSSNPNNNNNNNNNKGFPTHPNNNKGFPKTNRPNKVARPYFNIRPKRPQPTGTPSNRAPSTSTMPFVKKYKYGLRRGLPASNVNGYNAYVSNSGNLHQRQKPWYNYLANNRFRPAPPTPPTTIKPTITTTVSTTEHPLASKDVAPFGPEDAVTDVLRNELLYEYIRDRQGSIPLEERRSLS